MDDFSPETKMRIRCEKCDKTEMILLGDLPVTPEGKFLIVAQFICFQCFGAVGGVVSV